jgi:hypothetical protein
LHRPETEKADAYANLQLILSEPLMWEHVNPYGRFDLDMNARLALL